LASPEPGRRAGPAGALVVLGVLVPGICLIEFFVAQPYRPAAIRLVAAVVLLMAVSRIRAIVRASIGRPTAWGVDGAGETTPDPRSADPRFARFHEEIRFSARSQSYFEHLLWPRLVALARATTVSPGGLDKPSGRRLGRGPSIAALALLIAALEGRR